MFSSRSLNPGTCLPVNIDRQIDTRTVGTLLDRAEIWGSEERFESPG